MYRLILESKYGILEQYFYDFDLYHSASPNIPEKIRYGTNDKKLLIVANAADYSEQEKAFAAKIFQAVEYDLEKDAAVLAIPSETYFSINEFAKNEHCKNVIIFGIQPRQIGYSFQPILYQPFELLGVQYLVAHELKQISQSTQYKKALWSALKLIFKV